MEHPQRQHFWEGGPLVSREWGGSQTGWGGNSPRKGQKSQNTSGKKKSCPISTLMVLGALASIIYMVHLAW